MAGTEPGKDEECVIFKLAVPSSPFRYCFHIWL